MFQGFSIQLFTLNASRQYTCSLGYTPPHVYGGLAPGHLRTASISSMGVPQLTKKLSKDIVAAFMIEKEHTSMLKSSFLVW